MENPTDDIRSPKAIFFGAIGTLIETSDIQRRAFNEAFAEAELDWDWDPSIYGEILKSPGGAARIRQYAQTQDVDVDADAIHARKSAIFQESLSQGMPLRPNVAAVIAAAKAQGILVAFVTTTSASNVNAIFKATDGLLEKSLFDFVGSAQADIAPKPSPDAYLAALKELDLLPSEAIAVEDTPASAKSAMDAEIATIAFPGKYASGQFGDVLKKVSTLTPEDFGLIADSELIS